MKTLNLETTAPFQGLAELVAYNEGLFEKEDLNINWVDRDPTENNAELVKPTNINIIGPLIRVPKPKKHQKINIMYNYN